VVANYVGPWDDPNAPLFIPLHGWGARSYSLDQEHMWEWLAQAGWRVLAIDQPGFGRSPGKRWCSRSETNLDPYGPIQVLHEVLMQSGIVTAKGSRAVPPGVPIVVMGWSWGGGIAVSITEAMPGVPTHLILYCGSYTDHRGVLSKIRIPTYILWWRCDLIHPLALGELMARKISGALFEATNPPQPLQDTDGKHSYSLWSSYVRPLMYRWMDSQRLLPLPEEYTGPGGREFVQVAVT